MNSSSVYNSTNDIPNDPALPLILDKVYNCSEVVKIDYQIPGCPPSGDTLWQTLNALIKGVPADLPYELIRYD
jgi:NAD-reducing hydrogenase small subunit